MYANIEGGRRQAWQAPLEIIINLVGILYEKKRNDFIEVHYNFVKRLVDNIKLYKKNFVQVSALGVSKSKDSLYSKSKHQADI